MQLGPRAGRAAVSTRIRLSDTQRVTAIAQLSDGTFWSGSADVIVTLAACVEEFGMARALINVPQERARGEVIEIKTLISHVMETGFRHGPNGAIIPRDIITPFRAAITARRSSAPTSIRR